MSFISVLYILLTIIVLSWLHFHVPNFDDWQPQTFAQSMAYLFGGLGWFLGLMLTGEFFEILDCLEGWIRRRRRKFMTSIVNPNVKVTVKMSRELWEHLRYEGLSRDMNAQQVLTLAAGKLLEQWTGTPFMQKCSNSLTKEKDNG